MDHVAPSIRPRGGTLYADLRPWGGQKNTALGLPVDAPPISIGMAVARKIDGLRAATVVGCPTLPGVVEMDRPGMLLRDLVVLYQDARDANAATDGGASYVADCCRRIIADLGHLALDALAAPQGEQVLVRWRNLLWERKLANRTVKNHLLMLKALLRWGRSGGRRYTGPLPEDWPTAIRRGQALSNPIFDTWTESDFRTLREHCFDEALRTGGLAKHVGRDRAAQLDYVARRQLYLSLAFYTGAHVADLNRWRGDWLRVTFGRYDRYNQKSARALRARPISLDMPEQLRIDCEAEMRRLGREWRADELVGGGAWAGATRMLWKAQVRLFPRVGDARRSSLPRCNFMLTRRSTVREYTIRGWKTHEIAMVLGHVDDRMIQEVYRRCEELGLISPVRVPWNLGTGPGGAPTSTGRLLQFKAG